MGKTKPFIDKKNAKTYSLLYGDNEVDPVAPETGRPNTTGEVHAGRLSDSPHFAPEEFSWDLPDIKRKEIVELGLPDDGYDYLQHLKDPAAAGAPVDVKVPAEGPRVFLPAPYLEPPPEDIKYVDARSLPQLTVTEDEDILEVLGGVAPFARDLDEEPTDRANEVDALNEIMRELENADVDGEHSDAGDLLDDFVSTAAARASTGGMRAVKRSGHSDDSQADNVSEGDSMSAVSESSEEEDHDGRESRLGRAYVGSIASTYWRPERNDRGGLSAVDERFEQLALEYDSDELGDLEDVEGGGAGLDCFGSVLEKSMAQQITRVPLVEALQRAPGHAAGPSDDDDDARIAIQKARELLDASLLDEGNEVVVAEARRDRDVNAKGWDCESVLSMQTNLDNHPSLLQEPTRRAPRISFAGPSVKGASPSSTLDNCSPGLDAGDEQVAENEALPSGRQSLQRTKGETPEEKKHRKELVKMAKREARVTKKETKLLHKISRCRAASNVGPSQRIVPLSS